MVDEIEDQLNGAREEAELLNEYAACLEQAAGSQDDSYKLLVLDENLKMWVAIDASTKNPDNCLPQNIKTNLQKLSKYVEQITLSKGVSMTENYYLSLAEINRQISQGLMESYTVSMAHQEAYLLAKSGLDLSEAYKSKNENSIAEALDYNQNLWLMIKALMQSKNSKLPQQTRDNLIKLADYVAGNTVKLGQNLSKMNKKLLDSIININKQIAEGLLGHQ